MERESLRPEIDGLVLPTLDVKPLLATIERCYDAAEHPERLREALAALADLTGATSALLLVREGAEQRLLAASHGPSRAVADDRPLSWRSDSPRTVPLGGGFELVVDRLGDSPSALQLLMSVAPHLGRALRVGERLGARPAALDLRAVDLDRLAVGVVLLGADGGAVAINRAARGVLAAASALQLDARHLSPRAAAQRVLVAALVERVVSTPEPGRRFVGGRVHLADDTWGEIDLLVARFDTRCEGSVVHGVALVSARGATTSPELRFREMFGLDEHHAALAVELLVGRGESAADDAEAARAAIAALYAKLGTTRQTDLVRLLLRPPGVVFETAERVRGA
jgi:hypothetical protein